MTVLWSFEFLGHEVFMLQENRATWQQVRESASSSALLVWTGTWDEAQPLKETIDTIRQCGLGGIPTATLHLDIFFGSDRSPRKWWLSPMFFTRYVFTADGGHQDEWRAMGVDHRWLRPAVRHDAVHKGFTGRSTPATWPSLGAMAMATARPSGRTASCVACQPDGIRPGPGGPIKMAGDT